MPRKWSHFQPHSALLPLAKKCHLSEILFLLQELLPWKKAPSVPSNRGKSTEFNVSASGSMGGGEMVFVPLNLYAEGLATNAMVLKGGAFEG